MGKIRIKTLGDEGLEKEQKKARQVERQEASKRKAADLESTKGAKVPNLKGGQRLKSVGPTEEELAKIQPEQVEKEQVKEGKKAKSKKTKPQQARVRGAKYNTAKSLVEKSKLYPLKDALELLPKVTLAKFDETVELHVNTHEKGVSGNVTLPYGTGKKTRVVIADPSVNSGQVDELIKKIEAGVIDFDVLIATPVAMPKLAKVAKILGPRGLMPNPKNGTISQKPEELVKKYEAGQTSFKTEAKAPVIHLTVGKISFGDKKLSENIQTIISAVKKENIRNVTLKSTMSPGIKIQVD